MIFTLHAIDLPQPLYDKSGQPVMKNRREQETYPETVPDISPRIRAYFLRMLDLLVYCYRESDGRRVFIADDIITERRVVRTKDHTGVIGTEPTRPGSTERRRVVRPLAWSSIEQPLRKLREEAEANAREQGVGDGA